ncbi:MAG: HPP family protein [Paracoccaceae bacterium]
MTRLRALGPAMPMMKPGAAVAAAIGAASGLLTCDLLLWLIAPGSEISHLLLVAPFGASALLIFVIPNSPLAQPWSVVVGNSVSVLAALGVLALTDVPLIAAPLSVGIAIILMGLVRALHPPSGAVALATVLAAGQPDFPGLSFAVMPVGIGSIILVAAGIFWHHFSGRFYPFRQPQAPDHGKADPSPERRLGLRPQELATLIDRLRMAPNIGVEDLARVLDAAEMEAASHHLGGLTAADIMTRDLVTADADMKVAALADLFRRHGFKTLPLATAAGDHIGLIDQSMLLGHLDPDLTAGDLATDVATLGPDADAAALMALLAVGRQQAVPIVEAGKLAGLVTRSDLLALLSSRLREG